MPSTQPRSLDLHHAIGLDAAAAILTSSLGRTPTHETIRRWIVHGVIGHMGRVFLHAELVNGAWLTCPDWVTEFAQARG